MFRIITAFDSWHLNGVHCPSLKVGRSANTLQEAIRLYNESNYKFTKLDYMCKYEERFYTKSLLGIIKK